MKRLRNQQLTRVWPIGIGRIDQVHPQFHRALENPDRFPTIFWPTPDSIARNSHRTESEPIDRKVASDLKR